MQGTTRSGQGGGACGQLHQAGAGPGTAAGSLPQCAAHAPLAGAPGLHVWCQGLGGERADPAVLCVLRASLVSSAAASWVPCGREKGPGFMV